MASKTKVKKKTTAGGPESRGSGRKTRRPYKAPQLEILGNLSHSTLGSSPGVGDSANPATFKP